jgi:hypothetical protein
VLCPIPLTLRFRCGSRALQASPMPTCADGLQDLVSAEFGAAIQTHPRIPFRLPLAADPRGQWRRPWSWPGEDNGPWSLDCGGPAEVECAVGPSRLPANAQRSRGDYADVGTSISGTALISMPVSSCPRRAFFVTISSITGLTRLPMFLPTAVVFQRHAHPGLPHRQTEDRALDYQRLAVMR